MGKKLKKESKKGRASSHYKIKEKAARDSYTMPQDEYQFLKAIQDKCLQEAIYVKKSEILRVGLIAIRGLPITEFLKRWRRLHKLGPGRPRKTGES
jgi:hypothetical protein